MAKNLAAAGILNVCTVVFLLFALPLTMPIFLMASGVAASYFVSMLIAPGFPGTAWSDPEYYDVNPRPLGSPIQKLLSLIAPALVTAAIVFTVTRS